MRSLADGDSTEHGALPRGRSRPRYGNRRPAKGKMHKSSLVSRAEAHSRGGAHARRRAVARASSVALAGQCGASASASVCLCLGRRLVPSREGEGGVARSSFAKMAIRLDREARRDRRAETSRASSSLPVARASTASAVAAIASLLSLSPQCPPTPRTTRVRRGRTGPNVARAAHPSHPSVAGRFALTASLRPSLFPPLARLQAS